MAEESPYKFNDAHKKVYEAAMKAVDLKYQTKRTIKHRNAWGPALDVLKDKEVNHIEEGVDLLTDALIKYRKAAGIPVSEDKEDRHRVFSEIYQLLTSEHSSLLRSLPRGSDPEKLFKTGQGHLLLTELLKREQVADLDSKIDYELRKVIPMDADFDFYHGMAHYHASRNPDAHYSKGDLANLATRDGALGMLRTSYNQAIENQIKKAKPKPKEDAK